jgi:hypothetical protein
MLERRAREAQRADNLDSCAKLLNSSRSLLLLAECLCIHSAPHRFVGTDFIFVHNRRRNHCTPSLDERGDRCFPPYETIRYSPREDLAIDPHPIDLLNVLICDC